MPSDSDSRLRASGTDRLRHLDAICDQFEDQWRRGHPPSLEEFLDQIPVEALPDLIEELLALDIAYRRQIHAELTPQQYETASARYGSLVGQVLRERLASVDTAGAEATAPAQLSPKSPARGRLVGDFELLEQVGQGGMGIVYKARQRSLDRIVAIKMIRADGTTAAPAIERFVSEARLAATLHHPGIVPIHEIGNAEGLPYFAMEYVEGESLDEFVKRRNATPRCIAALVARVAETVHFAHEQGVLHRDIKPANVIVGQGERVRVMDFGLAKRLDQDSLRTRAGELLGTPSYMSPEQARGDWERVDRRSDVYSLGALLYALLAGRPPHQGDSPIDTIMSVIQNDPLPLRSVRTDIAPELERICLKCLAKDPVDRFPTVDALARDLDAFSQASPDLDTHPDRESPSTQSGLPETQSRTARQVSAFIPALAVGFLLLGLSVCAIIIVLADPDSSPFTRPSDSTTPTGDEPTGDEPIVDSKSPIPRLPTRVRRAGDFDPSFGRDGIIQLSLGRGGGVNDAYAIALQPDGKIVTAGQVTRMRGAYYVAVARFLPDGKLDKSFSGSGKLLLWFGPFDDGTRGRALLIQPDGKIILGARAEVRAVGYDFGLARLTPEGKLDESFGRRGLATANVSNAGTSDLQALALQPDGKIVAAENTRTGPEKYAFAVARFLPSGPLDTTFGQRGRIIVDVAGEREEISSLGVRSDGKIVAVGRADGHGGVDAAVLRLLDNGTLDEGFAEKGVLTIDFDDPHETANMMAFQDDRLIVQISGSTPALARVRNDGSLDPTFGPNGDGRVVLGAPCIGFFTRPDHSLIALDPQSNTLVVLSRDGLVRSRFGGETPLTEVGRLIFRDAVLGPDGRIFCAGTIPQENESYNWAVCRVLGPTEPIGEN